MASSNAQDIPVHKLSRQVSNSLSLSTSPNATYHSPIGSFKSQRSPILSRSNPSNFPSQKQLKPFATEDIKILLLENVNETAQDILRSQGYQVEFLKSSLSEEELIYKIRYENPW
jgi:D-3-phosphoglycerate dehydrogenase / 2-oxoglutarate reductase